MTDRALTPDRVVEIRAGAGRAGVPADDLVAAATYIRTTLLGAADDAAPRLVCPLAGPTTITARPAPARRRRVAAAALVAALVSAGTLAAGMADALPRPIQEGLARGVEVIGITIPDGTGEASIETPSRSRADAADAAGAADATEEDAAAAIAGGSATAGAPPTGTVPAVVTPGSGPADEHDGGPPPDAGRSALAPGHTDAPPPGQADAGRPESPGNSDASPPGQSDASPPGQSGKSGGATPPGPDGNGPPGPDGNGPPGQAR